MTDVTEQLAAITAALDGAEDRPGQVEMANLVATAIDGGRPLIVQAGTGTGKTLAYLVPAVLSGQTVVVSTATKALQDQLATKDLPFLAEHLDVSYAVLKGRSNYLCLQRLDELAHPDTTQMELDGASGEFGALAPTVQAEINRLADWSGTTQTGDAADLDWSPADAAWSAVSVGSDECPGADRCPVGGGCFAEAAKHRAAAADVIVVNNYLYGLDVASDGAILPSHDVVVFDEAHVLEDVMSDTVGVQIAPGRFTTLAGSIRRVIEDPQLIASIADIADALRDALSDRVGERLKGPLPDSIDDALTTARTRLGAALDALGAIESSNDDTKQRRLRAQVMTGRAIEQVDAALEQRAGSVMFVGGGPMHPRLEVAPLDVGPTLAAGVWSRRTAILTSATIPSSLAARVGIDAADVTEADPGSDVVVVELHVQPRCLCEFVDGVHRAGGVPVDETRRHAIDGHDVPGAEVAVSEPATGIADTSTEPVLPDGVGWRFVAR